MPSSTGRESVLIHATGLSKAYGDLSVLTDIDLKIAPGEIHGLIGVSGVGKSTLLRCINGLEPYDTGSLRVDNVELAGLTVPKLRAFRKSIGMIFQDFALLERKTVLENVALPMECWGTPKADRVSRALELLDLVGILGKQDARPRELSGGQKQRVAIARALALEPKVLLCDEATSALDPRTTRSVLSLLDDINGQLGITILIVTHEMEVVKAVCDRMSIMEDGRIVATGAVQDLFVEEPTALRTLIGAAEITAPPGKAVINVVLRNGNLESPVLSTMARDLSIDFSLLSSRVDVCRNSRITHVYIAVDKSRESQVLAYLAARDVLARSFVSGFGEVAA